MSFWMISWDLPYRKPCHNPSIHRSWFADFFFFLQSLKHPSYYILHILHVPHTYYCNHCSAMAECTLTHWPTDFCDRCSCRSSRSCCARSFARRRKRPWKIFQIRKRSEWVKKTKRFEQMQLQCDWHVKLCSILVTIFTRYCATVSYSITASPCITLVSHLFYPTSSTGMSRCLCLGGSQDLEGLSSLCSTCAHSGQENRKHTLENFFENLKTLEVYRASLPNGMQIAHARAYKELKWSLITYVQVLTFHPLFYSFLEVNTSLMSIDPPWLRLPHSCASDPQWSQILMISFRTAALLSPTKTFGKNRLKLGFHVLPLHFLWPVTPSSWSSCTSFWSELRRCKPAKVNNVKACWCWQAVFMSTKEFVGLVCGCFSVCVKTCNTFWVLGWQSLSFVEHFELHVYTENHLSKIMNRV